MYKQPTEALLVYDVFYSLDTHQHVSPATAAIFKVMLQLQEHKGKNVASYVEVTT